MSEEIIIGLFGTCDNVPWRDEFINAFEEHGIKFFNPDVGDDWHPGMVDEENKHLMNDKIILFPVLKDSLGTGSLGEIGFSVLNVMKNVLNGKDQQLIILIDDECTDERKTEAEQKDSNKARALVKSKVMEVKQPTVYLVNTLNNMLALSLKLHSQLVTNEEIRNEHCLEEKRA